MMNQGFIRIERIRNNYIWESLKIREINQKIEERVALARTITKEIRQLELEEKTIKKIGILNKFNLEEDQVRARKKWRLLISKPDTKKNNWKKSKKMMIIV